MKNFRADYINELNLTVSGQKSEAINVKNRIASGELQIIDHSFYAITPIVGTTVKMFDSSRAKELGLNNVSLGKPANNELMLLMAVRLTAATLGATPTAASMKAAAFANISSVVGFQNGVITLKSDKKVILFEFPLSNFANSQNHSEDEGQYFLKIPKWILPDTAIECELDFGGISLPANTVAKIELIGPCSQS